MKTGIDDNFVYKAPQKQPKKVQPTAEQIKWDI